MILKYCNLLIRVGFVWLKQDQNAVCHCLAGISNLIQARHTWLKRLMTYLSPSCQDLGSIISIVLHDAIAIAQSGCVYGWAEQVFRCFVEHGRYSPLVAGAPVEVQPGELQLALQMRQQAAFDAVPLDHRSCPGPGVKLCTYCRWFSRPADQICPVYWEVPCAGFDRASKNLGAPPCGHTASRGPPPAACLKVLQMCKNAGGCRLLSLTRQGRRAQPLGDPRGLSNPAHEHCKVAEDFEISHGLSFATIATN